MLSKGKRLNLKKDFKWMVSGKAIDTRFAKLYLRMGDPSTSSGPRVGIATSSKTFKKASQRNRARRLVSAAFESLYSLFPDHLNILALPRASILSVKSGDVLLDLEEALEDVVIARNGMTKQSSK